MSLATGFEGGEGGGWGDSAQHPKGSRYLIVTKACLKNIFNQDYLKMLYKI
jgi:hypothetical protein